MLAAVLTGGALALSWLKAVAWEADQRSMTGMMAEDWVSYVKR